MLNHTVTKNEFTPPFSLSCVLVMIQEVMAQQLFHFTSGNYGEKKEEKSTLFE